MIKLTRLSTLKLKAFCQKLCESIRGYKHEHWTRVIDKKQFEFDWGNMKFDQLIAIRANNTKHYFDYLPTYFRKKLGDISLLSVLDRYGS